MQQSNWNGLVKVRSRNHKADEWHPWVRKTVIVRPEQSEAQKEASAAQSNEAKSRPGRQVRQAIGRTNRMAEMSRNEALNIVFGTTKKRGKKRG